MARAIRKQLYLEPEQNRKLKRLAAKWHCTEAAVVRKALDQLPDAAHSPDEEALARLIRAGILTPPTGQPLSDEEDEALQRELDEWWDAHPDVPSLARIVDEDREGR